VNDIFHTRINV